MTSMGATRSLGDDIHDLGALLGDVLREQAGDEAFALVEELRLTLRDRRKEGRDTSDVAARLSALSSAQLETTVRAFSLYFLLTNLAEEHERVRRRRAGVRKQTLDETMQKLAARGMSADDVEALVASAPLMLTFTAHPTEMRRRTVRGHLRSIADDIPHIDPAAGDADARFRIGAHVEAL
jgi:phosphoenolpyruvate carboxylase